MFCFKSKNTDAIVGAISSKFTEKTLNQIVEKAGGHRCVSYEFGEAFNEGDSYLSELHRLKLHGETRNGDACYVNTVIKCIPKNIDEAKKSKSVGFFRNESNFYTNVMPELLHFANSKNKPFQEIATCFAAYSDGENDFIVLDDLAKYGYSTVPSPSGLILVDSQKCLRSLGRFHGLSLAYRDQHPTEFEKLTKYCEELCFEVRQKTWYTDFSAKFLDVARDAVHQEYPDTDCESKMKQFFAGDFFLKMIQLANTRTRYALLNHGDCWTPNFLLSNNTDAAHPACKLIDFQIARYGSPGLDLSFFIYSCTTQALRAEHYDQLLETYHQSATEMINGLGSNAEDVFPFAALQSEMKTFGRFGVGMSVESIPFSLLNDEDASYLDAIEGSDPDLITKAWIRKVVEHDGRLRMADAFKHATECGYLD